MRVGATRVLAAALLLDAAPFALCHELDAAVTMAPPAVILRVAYGGTQPVPFAKVQVTAPAGTVFQTGVSDARGGFSFVPDGPGVWRVAVDDEEGHKREVSVTVPSPFVRTVESPGAEASRVERALLGVALLLAATGFLYGYKARRGARGAAPLPSHNK